MSTIANSHHVTPSAKVPPVSVVLVPAVLMLAFIVLSVLYRLGRSVVRWRRKVGVEPAAGAGPSQGSADASAGPLGPVRESDVERDR